MRISTNTFPNSLLNQLTSLSARQYRLQSQAATGQRLQLPEDDPVAMRRVIDLQAEAGTIAQYQDNIARQTEIAQSSFSAIRSLKNISDRAGEIATLADGLSSSEGLQAYASELNELIKQAVQVMNTTNRGDYLFAGTRSDQPPFVLTADSEGQPVSVAFQGNTVSSEVEIAQGATVVAHVPGANLGGNGVRGVVADSRSGADLFAHLISLRDNLLAGNTAAIAATDQTQLLQDEDNILFHISANGALQARLEMTQSMAEDRSLAVESRVSSEVDADLTQTLTRLGQVQTAYQAALQSGATMLNLSLLDFLR